MVFTLPETVGGATHPSIPARGSHELHEAAEIQ